MKAILKKLPPEYVKVKVIPHHGGEGVVIPTDFPAYLAAKNAMETTFGKHQYQLEVEGVYQ